jgi:nicotinamide riboside kinase
VKVATSAEEFVRRCEEALAEGERGREARVALAEANSWQKRIDGIMALIEKKLTEKNQPASART